MSASKKRLIGNAVSANSFLSTGCQAFGRISILLLLLMLVCFAGCGSALTDNVAPAVSDYANGEVADDGSGGRGAGVDAAADDSIIITDTAATDSTEATSGATAFGGASTHGGAEAAAAGIEDLLRGIMPDSVNGKPADDLFNESVADFSIGLFRQIYPTCENSLISPLSVMLALAATANGAGGDTLAQMESMLGGSIPLTDLNEYLYSYIRGLPGDDNSIINFANAIWLNDNRNDIKVEAEFLKKNAAYFDASVFREAFNTKAVIDINNWVRDNTNGMIDRILDNINEEYGVAILLNAVAFDAIWDTEYSLYDIHKGNFTDINQKKHTVDFLHSSEGKYLNDGKAEGFLKPYNNGHYSFAGLLPNEDIPIEQYINSLTGAGFLQMLSDAQTADVIAILPKFDFDFEINLNSTLYELGMQDAFDPRIADFRKMAYSSTGYNICIRRVLHKSFISVSELGTKASTATAVEVTVASDYTPDKTITIQLDRPFVFAIIDNTTNLPLFIGAMLTID